MSRTGLHRVMFSLLPSPLAIAALSASAVDVPDKWVRYVEATGSQYVDTGIVGRPALQRAFGRFGSEVGPVDPGLSIIVR